MGRIMEARHAGLPVLLLDLSLDFRLTQEQLLALAEALLRDGRFAPRVCCPSDAALALAARKRGVPLTPLWGRKPGNPFSLLRLWWGLQRGKPLLMHSFSPGALQTARYLARLWRKVGSVHIHTCFTPPVPDLQPRILPAWQEADKILCGDGIILHALADAGLCPGRLAVVRPGVNVEEALPDGALPRRTRERFIFAAWEPLEAGRGVDVLFKAMAALWQRDDLGQWEVRVGGKGPLFDMLLDEARSLGVESRLALLGEQPPATVLAPAHALVVPDTGPHGNALALAWGWSMDMPVICTQVPGHAEARGGADGNALVLPPGDPQKLAAAMIVLMNDEAQRSRLAAAGWEMRPHVDTERMTRQCIDAYVQCVSSRGWVLSPESQADGGEDAATLS